MDLNVVSVEIAKLRLGPGDVLLVRCPYEVSKQSRDALARLVKGNTVVFHPDDVDFSVVKKTPAEAETAPLPHE